jgi:hypothetical protein
MFVRMEFSGFGGMVLGMQRVPVSDMGVVRGFLVVVLLVVFGGFAVVCRRMLVVFGR